jgi:hypothetical protein
MCVLHNQDAEHECRRSVHVVGETEDNLFDRIELGRRICRRLPQLALLDPAAADTRRPESIIVGGAAVFMIDSVAVRTLFI